jgi:hypothetical protein
MDKLFDQADKLGNTSIPVANRVQKLTKTELGSPEYTNFDSNRNAIVQEINTALSGSAQSSDMRVNIELENLNAARSPAQLHGALLNLNEALLSRLDSSKTPLWPKEVVQGTKSAAQVLQETISKYRGKYTPLEREESSAVGGESKKPRKVIGTGMYNGRKVVQYDDGGDPEYAD